MFLGIFWNYLIIIAPSSYFDLPDPPSSPSAEPTEPFFHQTNQQVNLTTKISLFIKKHIKSKCSDVEDKWNHEAKMMIKFIFLFLDIIVSVIKRCNTLQIADIDIQKSSIKTIYAWFTKSSVKIKLIILLMQDKKILN